MSEVSKALTIPIPAEGLTLKNEALNTIYTAFSRERVKTAGEIEALGIKAHDKVEAFNRKVAMAISKLPIDEKGKFPSEGFDGYKAPVDFIRDALGYKSASAYAIVAYARTLADPNAPEVLKKMSIFNHDAVKAANQDELRAAIAEGKITAETPQSELRKFTAEHPAKRKNGEVRVVTKYRVMDYESGFFVGGETFRLTADEAENWLRDTSYNLAVDSFNEAQEMFRSAGRDDEIPDCPYMKGSVTVFKTDILKVEGKKYIRYVCFVLSTSPTVNSKVYGFMLVPWSDKPESPHAPAPAVAPTAEEVMVKNTMTRRKCSEDEARAFLRENGLID